MAILALDQGTSATKAILLDDDFQVIKKASVPVASEHNQSGQATTTGDAIWQSVVDAITLVLTGTDQKISAVGLANQGESILAWDKKTGQPLSPVIIWQDSRSAPLCQERNEHSEFVLQKTGLTIDPYFVAPKITWLKQNYPQLAQDAVITTTDTYLIYKLTGEFVTDKATASRTLLFDLSTRSYQQQLADIWQIDISNLPTVINNDQVIGQINCKELPQLATAQLAAAIVDQPAALFAQNCFSLGQAKCTFGTGAFLLTNIADQIKISKNGLATSLAWQIRESTCYYLDGQVFTAASAVDWLIANNFISSPSDIDTLPDANGVIASPSFAGLGAPLWRPDATAIGVGYLAALAINPKLSIKDLAKSWQPARVYLPKWSRDLAATYLSRWRGVQRVSLDRES